MRREALWLSLVFVPFAALVWLGFRSLGGAAPPPLDDQRAVVPSLSREDAGGAEAWPPKPRAVAPPPSSLGPRADAEEPMPPELAAPLAALTPQLQLCLADARPQAEGAITVRLAFRPTPDGSFDSVSIQSSDWQDPYLFACLEDAFEQVRYAPTGRETFRPAVRRFRSDARERAHAPPDNGAPPATFPSP